MSMNKAAEGIDVNRWRSMIRHTSTFRGEVEIIVSPESQQFEFQVFSIFGSEALGEIGIYQQEEPHALRFSTPIRPRPNPGIRGKVSADAVQEQDGSR